MPNRRSYADQVAGRLTPFGPVVARAMFGGFGLYCEGIMFGLIAGDRLYFKVDDGNRADYVEAGTGPFTYDGRGKPIEMSYYEVPERIYAATDALAAWAAKALAAARRAKAPKKARRKPPARRS